jgi:hypothetical protein
VVPDVEGRTLVAQGAVLRPFGDQTGL